MQDEIDSMVASLPPFKESDLKVVPAGENKGTPLGKIMEYVKGQGWVDQEPVRAKWELIGQKRKELEALKSQLPAWIKKEE